MKTIYVCEDSVTGIYSGIYDAWKSGKEEGECGIALKGLVEQELFCDYAEVEESWKKAAAVDRMIRKNLGERTHRDLYYALLSNDREKGNVVLGTMMAARRLPDSRRIMEHLSHPMVEKVFELSRSVGGEAHNLKGFLRFRELENGVLVDVEMNVNVQFGYQVATEAVFEKGLARIGQPAGLQRWNAGQFFVKDHEDFTTRFATAYDRQIQSWVDAVHEGTLVAGPNAFDGYLVALSCEAGVKALNEGGVVPVEAESRPDFYA